MIQRLSDQTKTARGQGPPGTDTSNPTETAEQTLGLK